MSIKFGQARTDVLPTPDPTIWEFIELKPVRTFRPGNQIVWMLEPTNPPKILKVRNTIPKPFKQGNRIPLTLKSEQLNIYEPVIPCYGDTVSGAARIMEPVGGMLETGDLGADGSEWKLFNFNETDVHGNWMTLNQCRNDIAWWNAMSVGFCAVIGKSYSPVQATYQGGEPYTTPNGTLGTRERGEPMFNADGDPLYLRQRILKRTITPMTTDVTSAAEGFMSNICSAPQRVDIQFAANISEFGFFLDSPLAYETRNNNSARNAPYTERPILYEGAYRVEALEAMTTLASQAQYNYDICMSTKAVRGEYIDEGSVVEIRRRFAHHELYPRLDDTRTQIGTHTAGYTIYDVNPTWDTKQVQLVGQGMVSWRMYRIEFYKPNGQRNDYLQMRAVSPSSSEACDKYGGTHTFARIRCQQSGYPMLPFLNKLVRTRNNTPIGTEPARGLFFENGMFTPVQIDCQPGFGLPLTINEPGTNDWQRIFYRVDRIEIRKNKFVILVRPQYPYLHEDVLDNWSTMLNNLNTGVTER